MQVTFTKGLYKITVEYLGIMDNIFHLYVSPYDLKQANFIILFGESQDYIYKNIKWRKENSWIYLV
jgi:hypothetical protein